MRGKFDGACPVMGKACPSAEVVNSSRRDAQLLFRATQAKLEACEVQIEKADDAEREARQLLAKKKRLEGELAILREEAKRLLPVFKRVQEAPELSVDREALDRAITEVNQATVRLANFDEVVRRLDDLTKRQAKSRVQIAELEGEVEAAALALDVLGRRGVQRILAEQALAEIQDGANALLRECGIGLTVSVSWAREGRGLAASCDMCGTAYPASAKAKKCERCGADRQAKMIERLDVELSSRSGAAEDLAGGALQLAASAWLREQRDAPWSVALIDEPFGQLDAENRRAFAQHLAAMLRGRYGFEQALVVAHDEAIMDALPGRLLVRGTDEASSLVVA